SFKYSLLLKLRRLLTKQGYRSKCKIISVGNIVSGGSGKTPFTIFIADYLTGKGFKVAVSHRGYKGKFERENKLLSNEKEIFDFARDAGDEAFLLAFKLKGIPVIVGKNRRLSIKILEKKYVDLDYIILDDSFQHLKVFHDLDFVVFNEIGGIGNGFVLPAGILRESLSALKYADYIVFNGEGEIPGQLLKYNKPILRGGYIIKRFYDTNENNVKPTGRLALLSGIGLSKSFENTIRKSGLSFEKHYRFPDHYNFEEKAILQKIETELRKEKIDYLLITEKDFAKLKFIEHNLPLVVVEVEFVLEKPKELKF
ncbi:MAG: tetraacyldisaccharide 4'-kinase, partial [Candidatus Cloacimonetes bacterium]|nr:tetraacyldisaccharide 4'-kinase [Candidatus Cloacimonadota bacterium]